MPIGATATTPLTGSDSYDSYLRSLQTQTAPNNTVADARVKLQQNQPQGIIGKGLSLLGFAAGTDTVPGSSVPAPIIEGDPDSGTLAHMFDGLGGALARAYSTPTAPAAAAAPSKEIAQPSAAGQALAAPNAPNAAAAYTAATGIPTTTVHTGEHDPAKHTMSDFIAQNAHLTPLDLQMMTALMPPQLSPHDKIVNDIYQGQSALRDQQIATAHGIYAQAIKGLDPNNAAHAKQISMAEAVRNASLQKAIEDHINNSMKVISQPYGQFGALGMMGAGIPGMTH